MPYSRITPATVFSEQACPRALSSAVIRGLPYRPRTSAWTSAIARANASRDAAVGLSPRPAQA
jgi:hypothetical protein